MRLLYNSDSSFTLAIDYQDLDTTEGSKYVCINILEEDIFFPPINTEKVEDYRKENPLAGAVLKEYYRITHIAFNNERYQL